MEVGPVSEFSIGEDVLGISDITGTTGCIIALVGFCDGCRVGCYIIQNIKGCVITNVIPL